MRDAIQFLGRLGTRFDLEDFVDFDDLEDFVDFDMEA